MYSSVDLLLYPLLSTIKRHQNVTKLPQLYFNIMSSSPVAELFAESHTGQYSTANRKRVKMHVIFIDFFFLFLV